MASSRHSVCEDPDGIAAVLWASPTLPWMAAGPCPISVTETRELEGRRRAGLRSFHDCHPCRRGADRNLRDTSNPSSDTRESFGRSPSRSTSADCTEATTILLPPTSRMPRRASPSDPLGPRPSRTRRTSWPRLANLRTTTYGYVVRYTAYNAQLCLSSESTW